MDKDATDTEIQQQQPSNQRRQRRPRPMPCKPDLKGCGATFVSNIREMRKSPRDLAVLYSIAFLDSLSYYAFSYALIVHLGSEVGLRDDMSGVFYAIFGVSISVSTLVLGFVMDMIGIRWSICLSSAFGFLSRLGMAYAVLANSPVVTAIILFGAVAPSMALMGPAVPTAVKRYTTTRTRNFGFNIYYGIMNLAAFVATPAVDVIRLHTQTDVFLLPPYAMLIAITGLLQIPVFFVSLVGIRDLKLSEDGRTMGPITAALTEREALFVRIKAMVHNRDFWRAVLIAASLIGVKSSFRYFDALYLPYVLRSYSDSATFPYLTLLALNPAIVIAVTITGLITIITNRSHPVTWLIWGSFIGGIAPIFMAIGPYIISILLYVICTSVGEVIWSPVTYSYLMGLAGEGDEGAWMALAGMPLFLAKVLTGLLTGGLLARFCPDPALHPIIVSENGTTTMSIATPSIAQLGGDPNTCWSFVIWGIITLSTITSFVMLLVFRKFITVPVKVIEIAENDGIVMAGLNEDNRSSTVVFTDDEHNLDDDFAVIAASSGDAEERTTSPLVNIKMN